MIELIININIETDYNIGDMVYIITEIPKYNNLYRNETIWIVEATDFERRKPTPFEIIKRVINQNGRSIKVFYKIYDSLYAESEIFKDLDSALEECKKRNCSNGS